jgi:hypothetical protein
MTDLISRQAVLDIADDLRDRMTVEGYCAMVERVKALPSATCGNLEKPEIQQHSEDEAADCNLDCISRQMLLEYIHGEPVGKLLCDKYNLDGLIEQFPSAQPEIVRCNDCLMHGVCRFEQGLGLDGYCSQAERRTDGSD